MVLGGVPQKEGSPVISERMARLLRERWKEGLTGGAGLSGGVGERDWALAGRARAGGGRAREAEGWAARERVGNGPSGGESGWAVVSWAEVGPREGRGRSGLGLLS